MNEQSWRAAAKAAAAEAPTTGSAANDNNNQATPTNARAQICCCWRSRFGPTGRPRANFCLCNNQGCVVATVDCRTTTARAAGRMTSLVRIFIGVCSLFGQRTWDQQASTAAEQTNEQHAQNSVKNRIVSNVRLAGPKHWTFVHLKLGLCFVRREDKGDPDTTLVGLFVCPSTCLSTG